MSTRTGRRALRWYRRGEARARAVPGAAAQALALIINTGDDFEHLGLTHLPGLDTTLYTLAGLSNPELGWGRADETWTFMKTLAGLGG